MKQDEAAARNRRQEPRLPCDPSDVLLEMAGFPGSVAGRNIVGRIVGVSKSGLTLTIGTFVRVGESVRVTRAGTIISGRVRYCRPNDAGSFDSGIAILDIQDVQ